MPISRRSAILGAVAGLSATAAPDERKPRNVIFILTDDHRYDAFGFTGAQPFLRTPHLDRLAKEGCHLQNAFVTTSLCSPSRASILTGQYAHRHGIIDNNTALPAGVQFFPQFLQRSGYDTAFIGKWHMGGEIDDPQPGFNHWVAFRGQGTYLPSANGLNVNGRRVPQRGYITDELTDYALKWLEERPKNKPYFLYLSHKATHHEFVPADRHQGMYRNAEVKLPGTMPSDSEYARSCPRWVRDQRNSWHGVEFPYHSELSLKDYFRRYAETLMGVDESTGRVLDALQRRGELTSTLIIYMGDNGFAFGEHGLIDKRTAYEESMRVPLVARCPELFPGGGKVTQMVSNLDIMPTVLDAALVSTPIGLNGSSWLPLAAGRTAPWREELFYEYFWERNFPQTPTMHALRTDRFKYIHYYGIWDIDELYDLQADPQESRNLIAEPTFQSVVQAMNQRLLTSMWETGANSIPLRPDSGTVFNKRNPRKSKAAEFPPSLFETPQAKQ